MECGNGAWEFPAFAWNVLHKANAYHRCFVDHRIQSELRLPGGNAYSFCGRPKWSNFNAFATDVSSTLRLDQGRVLNKCSGCCWSRPCMNLPGLISNICLQAACGSVQFGTGGKIHASLLGCYGWGASSTQDGHLEGYVGSALGRGFTVHHAFGQAVHKWKLNTDVQL